MSAAISAIGYSVLGAGPIAPVEGRRCMLLVRVGRVIQGFQRVECRSRNPGLVHSPMGQQAELVLLKEPSGLLDTGGADSSDGVFEARCAQQKFNKVGPKCNGEI